MAERLSVLGVGVSAVSMAQAVARIECWVETRSPRYITVTPVHGLLDSWHDPTLRRIFNASGMTTPDGMPLVWLLRLAGYRHVQRVYGPDLLLAVCQHGLERGYRHFFYGGEPGVAEKLAECLRGRFPPLRVVGTCGPPFRELTSEEDEYIIDCINGSGADLLWVGLGTPKQEKWMASHLGRVQVPVMIGVGAAFDFLSGRKPQAPRWMQRGGLEWLFRLGSEPRRLWPRYRQYPLFILLLMGQFIGLIRFPQEEPMEADDPRMDQKS